MWTQMREVARTRPDGRPAAHALLGVRDDERVTAPPSPSTTPANELRQPSPKRHGFETVRDMVLSIALVGVVVLGVFWVVAWQRPEVQGPVRPEVDVAQVFADVRVSDPFPVLEPIGLPEGWNPTSAWFEPASVNSEIDGGVLHVGYVTPNRSYAEVRQTNGDRDDAVAEWVDDATRVDTVTVDGRQWTVVASEETNKTGLVSSHQGTTVVVTGKADVAELEELAAALR